MLLISSLVPSLPQLAHTDDTISLAVLIFSNILFTSHTSSLFDFDDALFLQLSNVLVPDDIQVSVSLVVLLLAGMFISLIPMETIVVGY